MDEHAIRNLLEGNGGLPGALLKTALWLPGKTYGLAMRLRRAAYANALFRSTAVPVPVISVGNLTAGGSGKTPMTILLAQTLAARGFTPAILLRGYRQSATGLSDEAVLYRTRLPQAVVEVNPDRRAGARNAIGRGADIILMDDGMQHLKLARDLDIVLIDATSPWGGGNTIPGGLLREPTSALAAAGAVVITRSNQAAAGTVAALKAEIVRLAPGALVLTARHRPTRLHTLDATPLPLETLSGKNVVAISGIARPEAFHKTLQEIGAIIIDSICGADHLHFNREHIDAAMKTAADRNAVVVTTEKDRAKKIFSDLLGETTDNNTCGASYNTGVLTLGVEQEVDEKESLVALALGAIDKKRRGQQR